MITSYFLFIIWKKTHILHNFQDKTEKKHLFSKQILKWLNINCREQKIRRSDDDKVLLKDGMSLLKISQQTGMPYTTLHDYLRGKYVGMDKSKSFVQKQNLLQKRRKVYWIKVYGSSWSPLISSNLKKLSLKLFKGMEETHCAILTMALLTNGSQNFLNITTI